MNKNRSGAFDESGTAQMKTRLKMQKAEMQTPNPPGFLQKDTPLRGMYKLIGESEKPMKP